MFNHFLPRPIDNTYRGLKLALWLLALVLLIKTAISLGCIFNGYKAASQADGIPLDTFTPAGARTVVTLFAIWGLAQLFLCLLGILALVRYRSFVPFMLALLLLEHLLRKLIFLVKPIAKTGTSFGFGINLIILAMMILALPLSLWPRKVAPQAEAG